MEYNKKLEEIEKIMNSIEDNNDLDNQMELYEKGKKKCESLEKKISLQRKKIENLENLTEEEIQMDNNEENDIKKILEEIENIYQQINSENLPAEKLEEFIKKSLILKKKSQNFNKIKDLNIKHI